MKCQNRERSVRTRSGSDGINPDLDLPLDPTARGTDTLVDLVATARGTDTLVDPVATARGSDTSANKKRGTSVPLRSSLGSVTNRIRNQPLR